MWILQEGHDSLFGERSVSLNKAHTMCKSGTHAKQLNGSVVVISGEELWLGAVSRTKASPK